MDILCPKCGEPWDMDDLHTETAEREPKNYDRMYRKVASEFRAKGCEALGAKHSGNKANPGIRIIYDMNGDDMDGAASMLDTILPYGEVP
jgi:hypothetical protein